MTADAIASELRGRRSGRGWMARCPAHEDRSPSLSITERDGRVLIHCHAGCAQADVIAALRARGLWLEPERPERTPADRQRWAAERRQLEHDLPDARYWRRTAVTLSEELLSVLKSQFFDPTATERPSSRELQDVTRTLRNLERMGDAALVAEYRDWQRGYPGMTAALVRWARERERAERRALVAYLRLTGPGRHAA